MGGVVAFVALFGAKVNSLQLDKSELASYKPIPVLFS